MAAVCFDSWTDICYGKGFTAMYRACCTCSDASVLFIHPFKSFFASLDTCCQLESVVYSLEKFPACGCMSSHVLEVLVIQVGSEHCQDG